MAFGDEFTSMFNPNGGYGNQVDFFGSGGGIDFSTPTVDYQDYNVPNSANLDYTNQFISPWTTSFQQEGTYTPPETGYQMASDMVIPMGDGSGGDQNSWFNRLGSYVSDKAGEMTGSDWTKLGLGGLGVIGNTLNSMQTNKMNKKAMKQNAKIQAYQAAAMDRAQKNAAIADRYNNSYDTTTAATAKYTPLTREQAMTYGETGAPHQQYELTPGVTTRNYLADGGFAHGGQADTIQAMLSEGEFVIPADVVSILGDGNTRAGGSALMQMMEQVRAGAGRKNTKTIPAKAKPVAAYLKGKK